MKLLPYLYDSNFNGNRHRWYKLWNRSRFVRDLNDIWRGKFISLYKTNVQWAMINDRNYPRGSFKLGDEESLWSCLKYDLGIKAFNQKK